jgi:hypothetical protein
MQGEAVLHEPLPVLLRCVHQLATMLPEEAGSRWAGPSDQHNSSALKVGVCRHCSSDLQGNPSLDAKRVRVISHDCLI